MAYNDHLGGRPPKEGLDYFPLETRLDTKFAFVQSEVRHEYRNADHPFIYACAARDIILRMYQQIYDEKGWYYPWDQDHKLLWIEQERLDFDFTAKIIDMALDRGIFHKEINKQFAVLTSKGLQERYINATYKRKKVILYKELILTDSIDRDNITIKSVSDVKNQEEIKFAITEIERSKDKSKPTNPPRSKIKEIAKARIDCWNEEHNTQIKFLDRRVKAVSKLLKEFTPDEMDKAIRNHAADPWVYENNQQANFDVVFRNETKLDNWRTRPPKNGSVKKINPTQDPQWMLREKALAHAEYHRKELSSKFYNMTEHENKKYFNPKFTNDVSVPEPQNT